MSRQTSICHCLDEMFRSLVKHLCKTTSCIGYLSPDLTCHILTAGNRDWSVEYWTMYTEPTAHGHDNGFTGFGFLILSCI